MAIIKTIRSVTPIFGHDCFIAETAVITGDVVFGDQCSIWYGAVVRGDVNIIRIGNKVNLQDGVIIHGTFQKASTHIGNEVSIAHGAIVHGCTIHDHVLIGMGAIIMDHAVVESNSIVAAGAVVSKNTVVESGSVYAGVPARKVKSIDVSLLEGEIHRIADSYIMYAGWYE